MCQETVSAALNVGKINDLIQWEPGSAPGGSIGRSHIFQAFDDQVLKKVLFYPFSYDLDKSCNIT
jgi:hypothetical protein